MNMLSRTVALLLLLGAVVACDEDDSVTQSPDAAEPMADDDASAAVRPENRLMWDMHPLPVGDGGMSPTKPMTADAAVAPGPPVECTLETVVLDQVEIFAYEASRVDANGQTQGVEEGEVCSRAGARPWTDLTRPDAEAVCATVGFRLCTNAEWGAACRGADQVQFPYGRTHEAGVCNDHVSGGNAVAASGAYPECRTPTGVYDLSGNVWEMTADGSRRGASFRVYASSFRAEAADCINTYVLFDDYESDDLGFRCCRQVE